MHLQDENVRVREYISIGDIPRLRIGIDPERIWFTDDEFKRVIAICGGDLYRIVTRCFLGIQQKARAKKNNEKVNWARSQMRRYDAGFITI